jgi:hypothetical protein
MKFFIIALAGILCLGCTQEKSNGQQVQKESTESTKVSSSSKKELLSDHVAEAIFEGIVHQSCHFRTSLCPNRCDHAGDFASFTIINYLDYQTQGKYADDKQHFLMIGMTSNHQAKLQNPKVLESISTLKKGDRVRIHWSQYYITDESGSFPDRPVLSIEELSEGRYK